MTIPLWSLLGLPLTSFGLSVAGLPVLKRLGLRYGIVAAPYSETLTAAPGALARRRGDYRGDHDSVMALTVLCRSGWLRLLSPC